MKHGTKTIVVEIICHAVWYGMVIGIAWVIFYLVEGK